MGHQIAELVRQILFLVGALVLLTFLHWQLMLTTLAVAPIVVLAGFALGRLLRRRSTEVQDRLAEAHAVADEAFGQIEIVQSFVRERWERARYRAGIDAALEAALSRAIVRAVLFGVLTVVAFGGIVIVLWQGGRLVARGPDHGRAARVVPPLRLLRGGGDHGAGFAVGLLPGGAGRRAPRVRPARSREHDRRTGRPQVTRGPRTAGDRL